MFEIDLKNFLETLTSLSAYPIHIPATEKNSALLYRETSFSRHSGSQLSKTDVSELSYQIIVVSDTTNETLIVKNNLVNAFENYSGVMGSTHVMSSRVINVVPIFDTNTKQFEYTVAVDFTIHRGHV